MKKKVLLTSIMTIAICFCVIAGSTFALFTDSSSLGIEVTAAVRQNDMRASRAFSELYQGEPKDIEKRKEYAEKISEYTKKLKRRIK